MELPINVRRFMGCILPLRGKKRTEIQRKRRRGHLPEKVRAVRLGQTALSGLGTSELEAQAKLHAARKMRVSEMHETGAIETCSRVCFVHISVDGVELRVIEEVEVLPTEVDCFSLTKGEALEEAEVEVQATRQI